MQGQVENSHHLCSGCVLTVLDFLMLDVKTYKLFNKIVDKIADKSVDKC